MASEFLLTVLYTQITVSVPETPTKGLLWNDDHVAQGFAWSPGFVSFGIPDHDGQVKAIVHLTDGYELSEDTLWAIQTPLTVRSASILIGTIGSEHQIDVPNGTYNLMFDVRAPDEDPNGENLAYVVNIHLSTTDAPEFAILKQGDELEVSDVLLTSADSVLR